MVKIRYTQIATTSRGDASIRHLPSPENEADELQLGWTPLYYILNQHFES